MYYYQHHIGDFIKSTSRLTDSQAMTYLRLIWLYYDKDGKVFNDSEQLAFEIGSDIKTVQMIIKTYFEIDGELLKHSRCDKELQGYLNKSTGGKKGAEARWKNKVSHSIPIAIPMPTQCNPNANQEPITNKSINTITPEGVSNEVFTDYLKLRKGLKAPVTETAIKGLAKEASKANMTLEQVMVLCCQNGWRGFKAEWMSKEQPTQKVNFL
jgi:uncharacterized protein YdaU (DUF1376 family)